MALNNQMYHIKTIKDEFAPTLVSSVYEKICQHRCIKKEINDLGKEIVSKVIKNLEKETETKQKTTSTYQLESNGLCEWQNHSRFKFIVERKRNKIQNQNQNHFWPI